MGMVVEVQVVGLVVLDRGDDDVGGGGGGRASGLGGEVWMGVKFPPIRVVLTKVLQTTSLPLLQ